MSKPFYLKSGTHIKASQFPVSPGYEDYNSQHKHSILPSELDFESVSDYEGNGWKNLADLDACSPCSSTPRSLSPLSSFSGSGDGHYNNRSFEFPNEPIMGPYTRGVRSPVLRPSTSLLEVSIANLPPESELKQCLLKIREQMALSLVRLKELEEQVRNVPTLQVRISVLQEEKRQLIKQLQSKVARKRSRSADYTMCNSVYSKGSKSDTENDDDDYSLLKKRLRVKLNSVGVGDFSVNDVCFCSQSKSATEKVMKSVCVGTENLFREETKQEDDLLPNSQVEKVKTRSIGVGMMRSFTKDVGVGDARAQLYSKQQGVQASVETKDSSCEALTPASTTDVSVSAKPSMHSRATITEHPGSPSSLHVERRVEPSETHASVAVQTSGNSGVTHVSIGVGICTIDDEPECRKCSKRKSRSILKTVDEIIANRIDIPLCKSVGVGDISVDDNYLCDRCSNLQTRTIGVGEKVELRNVAVGDFSISGYQLCDHCSNLKTRSVGCGNALVVTTDSAVGNQAIDQKTLFDRCSDVETNTIGTETGDFQFEENSFVSKSCIKIQTKDEISTKNKMVVPQGCVLGDELVVCEKKQNMRTLGVGNCSVMDSFCNRCDNLHTRSVGVGRGNVSMDIICDRCSNKKTKSVGTNYDIVETRSLGVSECCVTDNFCDRCMNIRTNTVASGDCCVTDSFCERCFNVQMHSIGVGDFDITVNDSSLLTQSSFPSGDTHTKCEANMNVKTGGNNQGDKGGKSFKSKQHSIYSNSRDSLRRGHNHSKESLNESDGSIDNDNPSSDNQSQTSEVADRPQSQDRIRIADEVLVACKLLNGHLYKGKEIGREQMISCMSTVENNWFHCVSSKDCDTKLIEGLVKIFKNHIDMLLETIMNLVDGNGNNALHYAVSFRNWKVVDLLLATGLMNLNLPNKAGYTPVMMAALAGVAGEEDKEIASKLFQAGDVNKQVEDTGQSSLMLAVSRGRMDMVEICLNIGADINAQDEDGSTALMCACEHGHINIAKRLLQHPECDASILDNEGSTALSIAMQRNFKDLALLIYGNVNFDPIGKPKKKLSGVPCKAS